MQLNDLKALNVSNIGREGSSRFVSRLLNPMPRDRRLVADQANSSCSCGVHILQQLFCIPHSVFLTTHKIIVDGYF